MFKLSALLTYANTALALTSIGCWSDNHNRALQGPSTTSGSMTAESCASFCEGYALFGTEYGTQCFCGDTLWSGAASENPSWVGCTIPCGGDSGEMCGGPWAMNLYIHC